MTIEDRKEYNGIPASSGKIYSRIIKISKNLKFATAKPAIRRDRVQAEVEKFCIALQQVQIKLKATISDNSQEVDSEIIDIVLSQVAMLEDPTLVEGVKSRIDKFLEPASLAAYKVTEDVAQKLESMKNSFFRERAEDIKALAELICEELEENKKEPRFHLTEKGIIVATDISPLQAIQLDRTQIEGFITEKGGITGHLAILARNYKIPCVVGVANIFSQVKNYVPVLMDGDTGKIITNPDVLEIEKYQKQKKITIQQPQLTFEQLSQPLYTLDGKRIRIKLNLDDGEQISSEMAQYSDGVGLYRSESLIYNYGQEQTTEELQIKKYCQLSETFRHKNVSLRAFDLGGDKTTFEFQEDNPFLGSRGIRYLLQKPALFRSQIRALLQANQAGNLSLMLPMITTIEEIKQTRALIEQCRQELKQEKKPVYTLPLGAMLETPSFAYFIDEVSKYLDFLSIGSNDLLQYTMAVDRNDPKLWKLNQPYHLSFLRLLHRVRKDAKKQNIPLGICGEIASIPEFCVILIGMGYKEISVSPYIFARIKHLLSSIYRGEMRQLYRQVLSLAKQEKYPEIKKKIQKYLPS